MKHILNVSTGAPVWKSVTEGKTNVQIGHDKADLTSVTVSVGDGR